MYQNVAENRRRIKDVNGMLGKEGKIIEFTQVMNTSNKFDLEKPYFVALIEFSDGSRITAQVVDADTLENGLLVEGVFRKLYAEGSSGLIQYGIKFRVKE